MDTKVKIAGLFTNGNVNSTVPPGALTDALNVVVRANGCLEPRRGMPAETNTIGSSPVFRTLAFYGNGRLAQYTDGGSEKLAYSTAAGGTWTAYSGTYSPVDTSLLRMKFVESNQNLYFNTSVGVKKTTALTTTPTVAGIPRPLTPFGSNPSGLDGQPDESGTWLPVNSSVAYRVVIGIRDANGYLKLGPPSARLIVYNPANVTVATGNLSRSAGNVTTATVTSHGFMDADKIKLTNPDATFTNGGSGYQVVNSGSITATSFNYNDAGGAAGPSGVDYTYTSGAKWVDFLFAFDATNITTDHFFRVYRTLVVSGNTDPGDEMYQIYEAKFTSSMISNQVSGLQDKTPETALYNTPLYTNPKTGEGIQASLYEPPICRDLALWQRRLWFANTTSTPAFDMEMLGVGSPNGVQDGDYLSINGNVIEFATYGTSAAGFFGAQISASSTSLGTNIQKTVEQLAKSINYTYRAYFTATIERTSAYGEAPGRLRFEPRTGISGSTVYIACSRAGTWSKPLPTLVAVTEASSSRTGSTVTITTGSAHGFSAGQQIMLAATTPDANFPVGLKTIVTTPSGTTFTYTEAGTAPATMTGIYFVHDILNGVGSAERRENGIFYSDEDQPEGVRPAGYFTVGAKNKQILRVVPLRDKLYVFKEDGLYTVSGAPPYHSVDLLDATAILMGPDTAVVAGGKIYAYTRQGIVEVSESGVGVVSYPIDNRIHGYDALVLSSPVSFYGVAYESERLYMFALNTGIQLVYNFMNKAWTQWGLSAYHLAVDPYSNKLTGLSFLSNVALVEKKDLVSGLSTDYYDTTGSITISSVSGSTFNLSDSVTAGTLIQASNSAYCLVTSNGSSGVSFVQPTGASAPATGAATYYVSPSYTVTFARNTLGQPGVSKHWRAIELHFGVSNIYRVSGTFSDCEGRTGTSTSDLPSFIEAPTSSYARNTRVLVPLECQRATSLQPGFSITQGLGYFRLDGITYDVDPTSTRTQK